VCGQCGKEKPMDRHPSRGEWGEKPGNSLAAVIYIFFISRSDTTRRLLCTISWSKCVLQSGIVFRRGGRRQRQRPVAVWIWMEPTTKGENTGNLACEWCNEPSGPCRHDDDARPPWINRPNRIAKHVLLHWYLVGHFLTISPSYPVWSPFVILAEDDFVKCRFVSKRNLSS